MNKNKIFLGIILGIFVIGLTSASITGYLVSGNAVRDSGYTATLQKVDRSGVATIAVETPTGATKTIAVSEGKTATVGGAEISVANLKRGTLFRRGGANVEINIVPPTVSGAGTGSNQITSVTEEECSDNCQAFVERYKLDEGETLNIAGDQISIDFISATQVVLKVNGQNTNLFSKGQWFELSNGQILTIEKIVRLEIGGEIGYVILSLDGYKLDEGEVLNIAGNQISIDFISATQVVLKVNGQNTNLFSKGQWFELSNGQILTIEKIVRLEIGGEIGYVRLSLSSCYFPYL